MGWVSGNVQLVIRYEKKVFCADLEIALKKPHIHPDLIRDLLKRNQYSWIWDSCFCRNVWWTFFKAFFKNIINNIPSTHYQHQHPASSAQRDSAICGWNINFCFNRAKMRIEGKNKTWTWNIKFWTLNLELLLPPLWFPLKGRKISTRRTFDKNKKAQAWRALIEACGLNLCFIL